MTRALRIHLQKCIFKFMYFLYEQKKKQDKNCTQIRKKKNVLLNIVRKQMAVGVSNKVSTEMKIIYILQRDSGLQLFPDVSMN